MARPRLGKEPRVGVSVRLDPDDLAAVNDLASRRGMSRSAWLVLVIKRVIASERQRLGL